METRRTRVVNKERTQISFSRLIVSDEYENGVI